MAAMETLCNIRHRAFNFIMTTVLTSGACVLNNEYHAYYTEKKLFKNQNADDNVKKNDSIEIIRLY